MIRSAATTFYLTVFLLFLALAGNEASAQGRNRIDHIGTRFHIAFLPTNGFDDTPLFALAVSAVRPTTVKLTYLKSGKQETRLITQPNRPERINLDTFELMLPSPPRTRQVTPITLLVESTEEITVYGINTMRWSSDAFVAFPDDALGLDYYVLAYPNTQRPDPTGEIYGASDFPSQFAVIATEPGITRVTIAPATRINGRPDRNPFDVELREGEVFLAQADGNTGADVTGTRVTATRKVVVYGSHQRTNVPFDEAVGRDHLVEQMLPINRWPTRVELTPHFQIPKTVADANLARVMAAQDGTIISVDSVEFRTLGAGGIVEIPLDRAKLITSNKPFQVGQYQHSSVDERFVSQANDSIGDPFFMMVASREQFDTAYTFESFYTKDFHKHYINIVIPSERVESIRLDGFPIIAQFSRIPKTSYSFAQLPVRSGEHHITARAPFGLYIYGYGPYNSYGYPGGMVLDTLFKDQKEPLVTAFDTCGGASGVAFDNLPTDFGMESLRLLETSQNVRLVLGEFNPGDDSIRFQLLLENPYEDGIAELIAVDTAGLDSRVTIPVKGFTVAIERGQSGPLLLDTLASLNGMPFCRSITIYNYGKFPQQIDKLNVTPTGPGLSVVAGLPLTLAPGESREVEVCFEYAGDTTFNVDVSIGSGCLERPVARIPLASGIDSLPPSVSKIVDPCSVDPAFQLLENGIFNSGIVTVETVVLTNATIELLPVSLPTRSARLVLRRIDPRQDIVYSLIVRDAVGLETPISDTIGGFTLAVENQQRTQVAIRLSQPVRFGDLTYGERFCDSIYLRNYGLLPLTLERVRMLGNLEYSIPPEQLPVVLLPDTEIALALCFAPRRIDEQIDTLAIDFACGFETELVRIETFVEPLRGATVDRCGNAIDFSVGGFTRRNFLSPPTPNPSAGSAAITFGLKAASRIRLELFDEFGNQVRLLLDNDPVPAGITRIDARFEDLPSGVYFLRMATEEGALPAEKVVIAR